MRSRFYIFFIFFLLFSATTYISLTSLTLLKYRPFYWRPENINIVGTILIFVQFFSIFLGGILAAFIIRVWILLVLIFSNLLVGLVLFEVVRGFKNYSIVYASEFLKENYVHSVLVFFVLFGIYAGLSKFILLVIMLDQDEKTSIQYTASSYLFILNLSTILVYAFSPSVTKGCEYYLYFSLPLILIAIALLLFGRWMKLYQLDSTQIDLPALICKGILRSQSGRENYQNIPNSSNNLGNDFGSSSNESDLTKSEGSHPDALLSFSKLCIIFISLLPYGICDSQLRTTYPAQSNFLKQPNTTYYAMKNGFWVPMISGTWVVVFILIIGIITHYIKWFDKIYSKRIWRIIAANLLMFLSILSAGAVESRRLSIQREHPNEYTYQTIDNTTFNATDMSVFYMTPQLLFSSISEILLTTTCTEFMYQESVGSTKYLAIAFLLGAVGSGGAGDVISFAMTLVLKNKLFNLDDLNNETVHKNKLNYWFYGLAGFLFITIIFTFVILKKFNHLFEKECKNEADMDSLNNDRNE